MLSIKEKVKYKHKYAMYMFGFSTSLATLGIAETPKTFRVRVTNAERLFTLHFRDLTLRNERVHI